MHTYLDKRGFVGDDVASKSESLPQTKAGSRGFVYEVKRGIEKELKFTIEWDLDV